VASPFTVFRRNQKVLLAIVGIGAMVAFVFLDPLMRYIGAPRQEQNPVVVETNFGNLTRSELENLKYSRELVDRFLRQVAMQVIAAQIGQGTYDPRWMDSLAERQYQFWHQRLLGRSQGDTEQAAVETMVLARQAEQMGMVISDQAINDLLEQMTADSINSADLEKIIAGLQPSRPISVARLFESIRTEMLASEYRQLFLQSMRDVPPAQRFEYYERLNRRANAEVMTLAVADFVAQVADPSDAELKHFYEKYKNDYPNPDSPEPGFKQPPRASFQYFKASVDGLAEKIKPEISEEEIKKYYEDNKAQFRVFDLEKKESEEGKPTEGEAKPEATEPKPEGEAGEKGAEERKPDEPAPSEKPEAEKPEAEKPADDSAPQALAPARGMVRLVSAAVVQEEPAAEAPPADKSAEAKPSDEKPADEKPAEDKPAEDKPAVEKPADESAPADKPAEAKPGEEEPPRFEPLEKVRDTIRDSLARQKAAERIGEQFDELSAAMRRYTDELDLYETEKGTNPKAKPPVPLDFAKLAEGKDVTAGELASVTAAEAAKADIGKAFRVVQNARTRMATTVPLVDFAFTEALPLYKAESVQDNDNNAYLFWKTTDERAFVPPLDQIRPQVVQAWKMIKARQLARDRAKEYAAQARALKKPLKELFANQANLKTADTGLFSWLTLGNVPAGAGGEPRLSEVEGVDRPGTAFMEAVFDLEAGGIGVAANEPQDQVYVVRLVEFQPPMDELRDDFARENPNRYMMAAGDDQRAMYRAWLDGLNEQAGVHWVEQPGARGERQEDEAGL
jgi:hypothetical protein